MNPLPLAQRGDPHVFCAVEEGMWAIVEAIQIEHYARSAQQFKRYEGNDLARAVCDRIGLVARFEAGGGTGIPNS